VSAPRSANPDWRRVFGVPLCLAAASGLGLIAAFIWPDAGRYLCWAGSGLPVMVIAGLMIRHTRRP
jgi:hypothetical protein